MIDFVGKVGLKAVGHCFVLDTIKTFVSQGMMIDGEKPVISKAFITLSNMPQEFRHVSHTWCIQRAFLCIHIYMTL